MRKAVKSIQRPAPRLWLLAGLLSCVLTLLASAHTDVTTEQATELVESFPELIVVDVREPYEYCTTQGHIAGARNYSWSSGELEMRYEELPKNGPVIVICRFGVRSNKAAEFLDAHGYTEVYDMPGDLNHDDMVNLRDLAIFARYWLFPVAQLQGS